MLGSIVRSLVQNRLPNGPRHWIGLVAVQLHIFQQQAKLEHCNIKLDDSGTQNAPARG